jgi:hypothetical protein
MHHWHLLTESEQRVAIVRLARSGMTVHGISSITGVAVKAIQKILGEGAIPDSKTP